LPESFMRDEHRVSSGPVQTFTENICVRFPPPADVISVKEE